jgi:hypothetical protein
MIAYLCVFIYEMILVAVTSFLAIHTIYMFAGGYGCIKANGRKRPQRHGGTDGRLEMCFLLNQVSIVSCLMVKEI